MKKQTHTQQRKTKQKTATVDSRLSGPTVEDAKTLREFFFLFLCVFVVVVVGLRPDDRIESGSGQLRLSLYLKEFRFF